MKKIIVIALIIINITPLFAQWDPEAKKLLDQVSAKYKTYETIRAKFKYSILNQRNMAKESHEGILFMKGDKYKLFFMGNEIFFDGVTLTTLMVKEQEATISSPDAKDESTLQPNQLFTIYEQNYKYTLNGADTINGRVYQIIELIPNNREDKSYSKLKLHVDQERKEIHSMLAIGKNGTNMLVELTEFKPNVTIINSLFTFNKSDYPGIDVIDLR